MLFIFYNVSMRKINCSLFLLLYPSFEKKYLWKYVLNYSSKMSMLTPSNTSDSKFLIGDYCWRIIFETNTSFDKCYCVTLYVVIVFPLCVYCCYHWYYCIFCSPCKLLCSPCMFRVAKRLFLSRIRSFNGKMSDLSIW